MTYYIHTVVELKVGQFQGYSDMMQGFAPYMATHGWKLTHGLAPVTGSIATLLHIWEVENFADIAKGMEACATDPKAHELLRNLPDYVNDETVTVHAKTPYSP